jgi:chorismate mutase / prephenate dehydratase
MRTFSDLTEFFLSPTFQPCRTKAFETKKRKNSTGQGMEQKQAIVAVRESIDRIDNQIVSLLRERIGYAKEIGKLKDEGKRAKWDPLRERQIYERLFKLNEGVFPEKALHSIFHEIITSCRLSQKKAEVAYLGPEATFSHLAGVKYFGHSADYKPMESIDDIFSDVEKGRVRYGIVPVENSI